MTIIEEIRDIIKDYRKYYPINIYEDIDRIIIEINDIVKLELISHETNLSDFKRVLMNECEDQLRIKLDTYEIVSILNNNE